MNKVASGADQAFKRFFFTAILARDRFTTKDGPGPTGARLNPNPFEMEAAFFGGVHS
jgi:hypothetical protein